MLFLISSLKNPTGNVCVIFNIWLVKKTASFSDSTQKTQKNDMDFDDMLEELGELGKYQLTTYLLICLPVMFSSASAFTYVFTAGVPNYRCHVPECDTSNSHYNEAWLNWAIPDDNRIEKTDYKPVQCERFAKNLSLNIDANCSRSLFTNHIERCEEWIFDTERTIVNDWNITCVENQWKLSLVGTCNFAGAFFGAMLFGILADKYGRKCIFLFCTVFMGVSGVLQVLSPNYLVFISLMFFNALCSSGIYPTAFILGVEMVGRSKRDDAGMILNYFCTVGEVLLAVIVWVYQDWVWLQLFISAPSILFVVYYWYIPESVRWLMAKEKNKRAKNIVCKVAKVNKIELSESLLDSFKNETSLIIQSKEIIKKLETMEVLKKISKSKKLILRSFIVFYIWAATVFAFYGLSINSTNIGNNKYLNFFLSSLIEIPGNTIAWICIRKLGRRISLIGSFLACGITCCAIVFVPPTMNWVVLSLFLIGKMGVTSAFGIIYVYTSELFPTVVRSVGVGASSTVARIGALLAPFVPLLGVYSPSLPLLLFGSISMLAGLLSFKLPETLGKKLPETVEDAEGL